MIKDYIRFEETEEKCKFANLAFTTINVDMASKEDREKVCKELNMNYENLTNNKQIHSDIVNIINQENIGKIQEGDALITNLEKTPLLIFVADCVPVAIMDPNNKAISLCHAGWRGTYAKITKKSIEKMSNLYNTDPKDLVCVLGPSIGPCCYEVSKDLIEKFNTIITNQDEKFYIIKEDKYYLDLWKVNELILKSCGVKDENIINLNLCTSCNSDKFHSYRKHDKTTKRLGMILEIK
ncbi:cytotoxic factor [[Clostridium] sordellii]|uniref:peptidoglycan editing factor PgeF n=2 Tax=Paraclostridium sordellii TaxID=1505 RepID=UPI0005E7B3B7|nr:peptidoglycan editing factor PgeF [Paeniclostridium sordellii]MDU2147896.1 peptidoglycan editing factor PgeF [Paeniclostridium sordellii]MDU2687022.1 peptidoglycan editing factor PgeF [Paeniclostridium sordellii]MDU4413489.1 peptidoglycan editing factor PgeF [Paeniclostridium sordellii]MRZ81134.1 peptidoglycan editing factor PgeF [Paeniclostridium sordellii]MSB58000.1 peptidoglycan editing factor PgeF [Paeniclostridium sordellii]